MKQRRVLVIPSSNNQNDVPHVYEREEEQKLEKQYNTF